MASAVIAWFARSARELPWRVGSTRRGENRDPYRALVAEAMLQQTQVSRVVEKFGAFIAEFPTAQDLAAACEQDVLRAWTGLGYYRRARNLHGAAKMIVNEFGGRVPRDAEALRSLPGVGRYTAGAIASIAFDDAAPIVDGNVARVLLRVHGKDAASDDRRVQPWLWERAGELVSAAESPAAFNEGLMELGATVCTPPPAMPRCGACPLRGVCVAHREGREGEIPRPKVRAVRTTVYCAAALIERTDGAVLMEKRGDSGMWAGMWQTPTLERTDRPPTGAEVSRAVGVPERALKRIEVFEFLATHRRMVFEVFGARVGRDHPRGRGEFVACRLAGARGLSAPQRRIIGSMCV